MRDWSRTTDAPFILLTNYLHWRKANWTSVNTDRVVMKAFHRDSALHVNRGFRGINAFWRSGKTKFLSTVQNELQLLWLCVVSARSRCPGYTERPEVRSYIRILEYPISSPLYRYRKMGGFLVKNDNADLITIFFRSNLSETLILFSL